MSIFSQEIIIESSRLETVSTMESVLFTKIKAPLVGKSKVSDMLRAFGWVEKTYSLNMKLTRDFGIIERVVLNSIEKN